MNICPRRKVIDYQCDMIILLLEEACSPPKNLSIMKNTNLKRELNIRIRKCLLPYLIFKAYYSSFAFFPHSSNCPF